MPSLPALFMSPITPENVTYTENWPFTINLSSRVHICLLSFSIPHHYHHSSLRDAAKLLRDHSPCLQKSIQAFPVEMALPVQTYDSRLLQKPLSLQGHKPSLQDIKLVSPGLPHKEIPDPSAFPKASGP